MANAVRVELRAESLRDDVHEVVLEVLRDARDERDADRGREKQAHAADELGGRVLVVLRGVPIDDVPKDERIEQREDLVDRSQKQRKDDQQAVAVEVPKKKAHRSEN